jgi:hypothetical protein
MNAGEPPLPGGKHRPGRTLRQQQVIMKALGIVIIAVKQADALGAGKDGAKTLVRRLLVRKAAVSVLAPGTQSLVAKYFTQSSRQRPPRIC